MGAAKQSMKQHCLSKTLSKTFIYSFFLVVMRLVAMHLVACGVGGGKGVADGGHLEIISF